MARLLYRPTGDPDQCPAECPYGHQLGEGLVLVGWAPCDCLPAAALYGGHRTYTCRTCLERVRPRIASVCYHPWHSGGGHPGMRW